MDCFLLKAVPPGPSTAGGWRRANLKRRWTGVASGRSSGRGLPRQAEEDAATSLDFSDDQKGLQDQIRRW